MVDLGYANDTDIIASLGEYLNIAPVCLARFSPDEDVIALVPKQMASKYQVIPLSRMGDYLTLAMVDPLNIFALDDLKMVTKLDVRPVVCTQKDFLESFSLFYQSGKVLENVLKTIDTEVALEVQTEPEEEEISVEELFSSTEASPVIKLVNSILLDAISEKASDIHIEPEEKQIRVRYRIDGVLYESSVFPPKHMQQAITSRLKIMSKLNIAEKRLPQDGRIRIRTEGRDIDFRVSCLPTYFGEKIVMRMLDKSNLSISLDALGFGDHTLESLRQALTHPHGMLLITGPTGSGKTTTLYSGLNEVNTSDVNIITVEDPVEYQLEGINQVPVHAEIGLTFAAGLRSILRQDPDIVMIGEIRDSETADIAVKAALTGHLVFSTLHTNDAAGAISRLDDMGIEPFLISSSLVMVAAQRLVRRICLNCKQSYEVSRDTLTHLFPVVLKQSKVQLFKGAGCSLCKGSGYKGRLALLEVLLVDDPVRNLIIERANAGVIKAQAIQQGMQSLRMEGMAKVFEGVTTIDEVLRVTAKD